MAGHGKVFPGSLFHRQRKTTSLIANEIYVTAESIFISKHSAILLFWQGAFRDYAILARRGNQQEARHFGRCFDFLY